MGNIVFDFKKIQIEDVQRIIPYFENANIRMCDYSIGTIYMWKDYYDTHFCIEENFLILRYKEAESENYVYSYPISKYGHNKLKEKELLMKLRVYCNGNGYPLKLVNLLEEMKNFVLENFPKEYIENVEFSNIRDWADYMYDWEDLAYMKGRRYSSKRNHINNFMEQYPKHEVRIIGEQDIEKIKLDYINYFISDKILESEEDEYKRVEYVKTIDTLEKMFQLGMVGVYIEIEGKVAGFSIGEIVGDTIIVHIEKGRKEYKGIYTFLCREFVRLIYKDGVKYVNREEDMGVEGLRQSKLSYRPAFLLYKYSIDIN